MVSSPLTVELDKFVSVLCIKYHLSFTLIVDAIGFKLYKEIIFIFGGCCSLLVVAVALAGRMVVEAMLFLAPQQCLLFIHVSIS